MRVSAYGPEELRIEFRRRTPKADRVAAAMQGNVDWSGSVLTVEACPDNISAVWAFYPRQKILYYGARNRIDGKKITGKNAQLPLAVYSNG